MRVPGDCLGHAASSLEGQEKGVAVHQEARPNTSRLDLSRRSTAGSAHRHNRSWQLERTARWVRFRVSMGQIAAAYLEVVSCGKDVETVK